MTAVISKIHKAGLILNKAAVSDERSAFCEMSSNLEQTEQNVEESKDTLWYYLKKCFRRSFISFLFGLTQSGL